MKVQSPAAVILLAHLMDADGTPGTETRARADLAARLASGTDCKVALMGWAYRPDTDLCISDAMAGYLQATHGFAKSKLLIDRRSRDTVGDAVFSKMMLTGISTNREIVVATSDYHADRALKVFRFVYGPDWQVSVTGAAVGSTDEQRLHERQSLAAFERAFEGIASGDDKRIRATLVTKHPYYNGEVHPALRF
jgi:uncharacterized SAM-binding protein YcdF (DUF218 family)